MSDENTPAASSPAEIQIPKSRFDEEIAKRRELEQQLQFQQQHVQSLSQMLMQARGQQPQRPVQEDPEMEALKQDNPVLYRKLKDAEAKNRQLSAAFFSVQDRQDRSDFVAQFGDAGKKRLAEVERILDAERRRTNGNTQADRAGIYRWLLGEERIRAEANPAPAPAPRPAAPAPAAPAEPDYTQAAHAAPPSDPTFSTSASAGTAGKGVRGATFEDREKELENVAF